MDEVNPLGETEQQDGKSLGLDDFLDQSHSIWLSVYVKERWPDQHGSVVEP